MIDPIVKANYLVLIANRELTKRAGSIFELKTWWQYELAGATGYKFHARCYICDQVFDHEYWSERGYEHGDVHLKNIAAFL